MTDKEDRISFDTTTFTAVFQRAKCDPEITSFLYSPRKVAPHPVETFSWRAFVLLLASGNLTLTAWRLSKKNSWTVDTKAPRAS